MSLISDLPKVDLPRPFLGHLFITIWINIISNFVNSMSQSLAGPWSLIQSSLTQMPSFEEGGVGRVKMFGRPFFVLL